MLAWWEHWFKNKLDLSQEHASAQVRKNENTRFAWLLPFRALVTFQCFVKQVLPLNCTKVNTRRISYCTSQMVRVCTQAVATLRKMRHLPRYTFWKTAPKHLFNVKSNHILVRGYFKKISTTAATVCCNHLSMHATEHSTS